MWDETLIESGRRSGGKRRWNTVSISVVLHAAVLMILAFAAFWSVEAVPPTFPAVPFVHAAGLPVDNVPVAIVRPRGALQGDNKPVKPTAAILEPAAPVSQQSIDPNADMTDAEVPQSSLPFDPGETGEFGTGPVGTQDGIDTAGLPFGAGSGEDDVREITVGVEQPTITHRVLPEYPESMRKIRKEGIVVLKAIVTRNGDVEIKGVERSLHPILDREAIRAVSQWKYRPATVGGRPVSVWFTVTVSFKLV